MDATQLLMKELTEALGPPGNESQVRAIMRRELTPLASEIEQDGLGSIIAKLPGSHERPRIMLAGHMDEVGFLVRHITDNGFIKFLPLGGWWDQVLIAHEVIIRTHKGDVIGLIGAKSPRWMKEDERNRVVDKDSMYIDVGVSSRKEVEEMGVRVGDPILPKASFTVLGNGKTYLAKAWDDRVGCALIVEVFKALQGQPHPNTVYGVGTVQEEVGLRGAKTAAHHIDPDIGLILEVGLAGDIPGTTPEQCAAKLGGGVELVAYDASMVPNTRLRDLAIETAIQENIPYQVDVIPAGGTDGGVIHTNASGVPSLVIGVPTRHIHTHYGLLHRDDFDAAVRLVVALVKRLDAKTVAEIKA